MLTANHAKYLGEKFICDSGAVSLGKSEVNDGYCDCADKSDEPGTSACSGNKFSCVNDGYKVITIDSSRVDDSVCDCCDGSDEGVITACPNTCFEASYAERAEIESKRAAYKAGIVVRTQLIDKARKENEPLVDRLKPMVNEFEAMDKRIAEYNKQIESIEKKAEDRKDQLIQGSFTRTVALLNLENLELEPLAFMLSNLLDLIPAEPTKDAHTKDAPPSTDTSSTLTQAELASDSDVADIDDEAGLGHDDYDGYGSDSERPYDDYSDHDLHGDPMEPMDGEGEGEGEGDMGGEEVPSCRVTDKSTCSESEQKFLDKVLCRWCIGDVQGV